MYFVRFSYPRQMDFGSADNIRRTFKTRKGENVKKLTRTVSHEVSYKDIIREASSLVDKWMKRKLGAIAEPSMSEEVENIVIHLKAGAIVAIGSFVSLMAALADSWVHVVWVVAMTIVIAVPIDCISVRKYRQVKRDRKWTRSLKENQLRDDPLFKRGEMIHEAVESFCAHCDRYEAWREAVERELEPEDVGASERYRAMLDHALTIIEQAIRNFSRAQQLEVFMSERPALQAAPKDTALSQLIATLDQPMESPRLALTRPRDALDFEDELAAVTRELADDGASFDVRLRASTAKARVADPEDEARPDPEAADTLAGYHAPTA